MTAAENLFQLLRCSELDQTEFEQVVISYYGHGYHPQPQEIHHARTHRGCALRTLYDEDGKLINVLGGPDLATGELEELRRKIEAELLTQGATKVRRSVLFFPAPTVGYFRYRDVFQIVPVPPEAPRPTFLLGDHPLFLEFKVHSSSNFMITGLRYRRAARELELLLSSLLNLRIWSIGPETRHHWSIDISEDAIARPSKFLQEGYSWSGPVLELDDFSSTEHVAAVQQVDPHEYYSSRGISIDRNFDVPSDIEQQLDKFFSLPIERREKFLRASYWFQHAHKVFHYSKSASFIALVSAIEALMPPPKAGRQCPHCKQVLGSGPTKQFVDFVEAFIPCGAVPEAQRKRFYRVRSALSHGGKLLLSPERGIVDWLWECPSDTIEVCAPEGPIEHVEPAALAAIAAWSAYQRRHGRAIRIHDSVKSP